MMSMMMAAERRAAPLRRHLPSRRAKLKLPRPQPPSLFLAANKLPYHQHYEHVAAFGARERDRHLYHANRFITPHLSSKYHAARI